MAKPTRTIVCAQGHILSNISCLITLATVAKAGVTVSEAIFRDSAERSDTPESEAVDRTLARWGKGKETWNAWADELLRRKARLIEAGEWAANPFGEGENAATRAWLDEAGADFADQVFPEAVHFAGYIFPGPVNFAGCAFSAGASFDDARFEATATFAKARFDAPVSFKRAVFGGVADFDDASFAGDAEFEHAQFAMVSDGPLVTAARFSRCVFEARANFREAIFKGNAKFARTRFSGGMRFDEAQFAAASDFSSVSADGIAAFSKTGFRGDATFADAELDGEARFGETRFEGDALFERAEFDGGALFRCAEFNGNAAFDGAKFAGEAHFNGCAFAAPASFADTRFKAETDFSGTRFSAPARFQRARLRGPASFGGAGFLAASDFSGLRADCAVSLADTRFVSAPDFLSARFTQPPRMETMRIDAAMRRFRRWRADGLRDPRPWPFRLMAVARDGQEAARFRQLRHLARDGLDHEREGAFYAEEIRASRFWRHRPLGRGGGRFWLGWLYGGMTNFGRSALRPLFLWALNTFAFALVYLTLRDAPAPDTAAPALPAWPEAASWDSARDWLGNAGEWAYQTLASLYSSGGCVTGEGSASAEAFYLSLKNSLFFLPWESPLTAQRVYGCLYGLDSGAAIVPLAVSVAALAQNVIGAVLLVLVALGLSNLLKRS